MANQKRNSKGQFTTNNGTWFKNAAKSLGYAGIDLLKETMPTVMETVNVNKEFATDLVKTIRRDKNKSRFNIKYQLSGKALENWNDIEEIVKNAKSDLKTGNFYNKEREKQLNDDFGLDDFDMDDDFSFDMSDDLDDNNFDADEKSDVRVVSPNVTINSNINKDNPMVKAVQQQTRLMSDNEATSARRDIEIAETQMKLDKQIADVLYGGMNTINTNLTNMIAFNNEHVSGYIGASFKYYEDSIRIMSEMNESLKRTAGLLEKQQTDYPTNPLDALMSGGGFNISEYMKLVRKQFKTSIDESLLLGSISSMLEGDGLKAFIGSPLTFLPQLVLTKMVPEFLTTTFKNFDNAFKSFIPALLNKMGSWADEYADDGWGYLKQAFGKIAGIKNTGKIDIDTSKYEKGVVPFDGLTRKSIVEVIPGYLSKILSALTGKEEMLFNYDQGKFVTKSMIHNEYANKEKRALSSYESLEEMKSRVKAYKDLDESQQRKMQEDFDTMFMNLTKRKKYFNITDDNEYDELLPGVSSGEKQRIKSIIMSLSKSQRIGINADHINARNSLTQILTDMENSGNLAALAKFNNLLGEDADYLANNPLINKYKAYDSSSRKMKDVGSIFTPSDKYGKNSLNYLHDIYKTLLEGIGVWMINPISRDRLSEFTAENSRNDVSVPPRSMPNGTPYIFGNDKSIQENVATIDQFVQNRDGNLTDSQANKNPIDKLIKYIFGSRDDRHKIVSDSLDRLKYSFKKFFDNIDETMYRIIYGESSDGSDNAKGQGLLSSLSARFKVWLFGEKDNEGKSVGGIFNRFHNYLKEKIYDPIKDALIGENGVITRFKQTEFYKNIVNSLRKTTNSIFGEKDSSGKRVGGKLSSWMNSASDFIKGTRVSDIGINATGEYYNKRTGDIVTDPTLITQYNSAINDPKFDWNNADKTKVGGVFGTIRAMGSSFKDNVKEWLFGTNPQDTKDRAKGIFTDVAGYFKQGLQGFTDAVFGQHYNTETNTRESNVMVDDVIKKVKEGAPKTIASGIVGGGIGALAGIGGFGLLGSLFLGPMSGVVIGTATGLLSQSETFKNWLFGEKDEDGNRIGGFISKSTQEFFKKHKGAAIGGAALGMLKGITGVGILPSFILGGPLTGAIFGMGASLLTRSETFQNFLFGVMGEDGKRHDGLINKLTGAVDSEAAKKKLGFAGAGAALGGISGLALSSFGILGSVAFGPLSGAILGAGAGIALAADKWKTAIFGDFDKNTGEKTKDGILGKMMTAVNLEVLQPAKIQVKEWSYNVQDWFLSNIADPFMDSLDPLREELSRFKDRIKLFVTDILDKTGVGKVLNKLTDTVKNGFTKITSFISKYTKKGVEALGKFTGFVLSSPVKLINLVAEKILLPKHMREGIRSVRNQIIENIKQSKVVQRYIKPVYTKVINAVDQIKEFTKNTISTIFEWTWKGIKGIGKGLIDGITAPFKGIGLIGKGIASFFGIDKDIGRKRDTDRLNSIITGSGGNRSFTKSIGDLVSLANPFSSLRRAAKYSSADVETVRQRVLNTAAQNGETLSDEELDKRVRKELWRNPGGAGYIDKWKSAKEERKAKRKEQREKHKAEIESLRAELTSDRNEAKDAAYDIYANDKLKSKYGRKYKSMSKMDQDKLKNELMVVKTTMGIDETTKELVETTKETSENIGAKIDTSNTNAYDLISNSTDKICNSINNIYEFFKGLLHRGANNSYNNAGALLPAPSKDNNIIDVDFEDVPDNYDTTAVSNSTKNLISGNNEDKVNSLWHDTAGETEIEDRAQRQAEEEKKNNLSFKEKLLNLIGRGNEDRKEHNNAWDFIFSKKGLITAGIVALLPILLKFLKNGFNINISNIIGNAINSAKDAAAEVLGLKDDDGDRTDSTGDIQTNDNMIETAAMGATKLGVYGLNKAYTVGKAVVNGAKAVGSAAKYAINAFKPSTAGKFTAQAVESVDDVIASAKSLISGGDDLVRAAGNTAKSVGDDIITGGGKFLKEANTEIIDKFIKLLSNGIDDLTRWLANKFPNFASSKGGKLILKGLNAVLKTPAKGLLKFVDKIITGIEKIASSTATAYILDAGFVIYGGLSGASKSETANIFGVSQDDVNSSMRIAAGSIKALLSFSWFFIITLASDISVSMGGPDIVRLLAQTIYSLIVGGDIDKLSELTNAQEGFTTEYNDYVGIQEYLKGNAEITTNEDGTRSFTITDTSQVTESFDSFNDRTNKSVASKIWNGIKGGYTTAKTFFVGQKGDEEKYAEAQRQSDELEQLADQGLIDRNSDAYKTSRASIDKMLDENATKSNGIGAAANWIKNTATNVKNKAVDLLKPVTDFLSPYFNMGKELLTFVKDVVVNSLKQGIDDDATNVPEPSEDDPLGGIKKVLFYGIKVLMLPRYLMLRTGKFAWEKVIKPTGEAIMNLGKGFIEDTSSMLSSIKSGGIFTSQYWKAPENEEETTSTLRKVGFYAQRILSAPQGLMMTIGNLAWEKLIKPAGSAIMNLGKGFIQDSSSMVNSIRSGQGIFTSQYWSAPENGDATTTGLRKVGFYAQRILSIPQGLMMTIGNLAWEKLIKPAGSAIMNLGKGYIEDSSSMVNSIRSGQGIFTSQYWSAPENGDATTTGLRKVGFYAQRILSAPSGLVMTIGNLAWENLIKPAGSAIMNLGKAFVEDSTSMMNAIRNGNNIFTSQYWTAPTSSDGTVSGLRKVGFYAQRILSAPAGVVMTVSDYAVKGLSSLWSGLTSIGSFVNTVMNTDKLTNDNYWTSGKPSGTGISNALKTAVFYIGRGFLAPGFYIEQVIKKIGTTIKDKFIAFTDALNITKYFSFGVGGPVKETPSYGIGGPVESNMINEYGVSSPYNVTRTIEGKTSGHKGIDLTKAVDSPVLSFTDGTVTSVTSGIAPNTGYYGSNAGGGFGNRVEVQDSAGYKHIYAHMNGVNVSQGAKVLRGTKLGILGNTGSSTGPHLHYQVYSGTYPGVSTDPVAYLRNYNGISESASGNNSSTSDIITNISGTDTGSTPDTEATGLIGVASKLSSAFTELLSPITSISSSLTNAFSSMLGQNASTDSTSDNTSNVTTSTTSSSNTGISASSTLNSLINNPTNATEELVGHILQQTFRAESGGNYSAVNANDNGSYSVGSIQFHGNLAKIMFTRIANKLTNSSLKQTANKFASISNRALTSSEKNEMVSFLNDPQVLKISQEVQDEMAKNQILSNMEVPLAMLNNGTLMDMRSVLIPTDIGNTGPAHLSTWRQNYKKSSNKSAELAHVRDSLKSSDSWWGRQTGSQYYKGWMNRIDAAYKDAASWNPKFGGGIGGPVESDNIDMHNYNRFNSSNINTNASSNLSRVLQNINTSTDPSIISYLKQIVDGITSIVTNTSNTNNKLEEIKTIESEKKDNTNVAVIDNSNKTTNSPMYDIASNRRANKINKGYQTAKAIASAT